jgi:BASS family bile acid:Na+ symporter
VLGVWNDAEYVANHFKTSGMAFPFAGGGHGRDAPRGLSGRSRAVRDRSVDVLRLVLHGASDSQELRVTVWVFAFVAASMFYPVAFMTWGGYDLKGLIVPLMQIIMFGMGTTLSVADFTRVFKMPWPVFIGFTLQFTIMPLTGFVLAKSFGFPNEIAAGVI